MRFVKCNYLFMDRKFEKVLLSARPGESCGLFIGEGREHREAERPQGPTTAAGPMEPKENGQREDCHMAVLSLRSATFHRSRICPSSSVHPNKSYT